MLTMLSLLTVDGDGLGPDPDVDEVPSSTDPNGGLAAYVNAALPPAALAARGATFSPYPGTKQAGLIKDIISEWTLTQIDLGLGQVSHLVTMSCSRAQLCMVEHRFAIMLPAACHVIQVERLCHCLRD